MAATRSKNQEKRVPAREPAAAAGNCDTRNLAACVEDARLGPLDSHEGPDGPLPYQEIRERQPDSTGDETRFARCTEKPGGVSRATRPYVLQSGGLSSGISPERLRRLGIFRCPSGPLAGQPTTIGQHGEFTVLPLSTPFQDPELTIQIRF